MIDSDAKKKKREWQQHHLQASIGFTGLPNRLVDSKPFAELTTGAAVQSLVWFWQMVEYEKKRKGGESYIGRIDKMTNNGELSFTYQEAEWRGMKQGRFNRAKKELFRLGFIDVKQEDLGRGVKGKYTKFSISDRWKRYGTPEWQEIPFPENFQEGFRSEKFKERRRKEREARKNSVQKQTLQTFKNERYEADEIPHIVQNRTLKTHLSSQSQRLKTDVSIDLAMPTRSKKKVKKRTRTMNSRSKGAAAVIRRALPFTKPKILECQFTPKQMDDFLREVANVRSWT